ncbi:MAG TPA: carboxypeptidase regulatory-like domain-containing protein, partial [Rugosimonospora sp.]|nr:carboxypeptidase regulatory-like domain-containing protein [Rugosimonospora sp.]
ASAARTARCFAMVVTPPAGQAAPKRASDAAGPAATALGPADIRAAYHLPDSGQGQTVAIVDAYGDSHVEADLAAFRAYYGLSPCTSANGCFRRVDQNGGNNFPVDDRGWGLETSLDVDAVSAACPNCDILLVQSTTPGLDDLGAGVDTAVRLGAKYISNSYGLSIEDSTETAYDHYYDHPGVVVTASSGDTGNQEIWPAANPNVVAVGGTRLTRDASTARGWTESAWSGGGSGCSPYEPQPVFQAGLATACPRRAEADLAADADPRSGLAVYDTLGYPGWNQVGGTSLASPLIAAAYALAGPPVAGTYPVSYPYLNQGNGLFDVVTGGNGPCGNVLCTAGTGWDGPTGLGTPDGAGGLAFGPHGTLQGRVTDSGRRRPVAGAALAMTDATAGRVYHATTDAQGTYTIPIGVGQYTVTVSAFGYAAASRTGVTATDGATVTADFALARVPTRRVSGRVTDGSGHGWPLSATITIGGYPGGAIATDPFTGGYAVDLPQNASYTLHVAPTYPGYRSADLAVALGSADQRRDIALGVDTTGCTAPGYAYPASADFEDWSGRTAKPGWSVVDHGSTGLAWQFDDPQLNVTGGSGNYAAADPYDNGGTAIDADLVSPVVDLGDQAGQLAFDTAFAGAGSGSVARADVSDDAGQTWTPVWSPASGRDYVGHVSVVLPRSAAIQVRFHFTGAGLTLLEIDNVRIGQCGTVPGGLVGGIVRDGNTGSPVGGATVSDGAVSVAAGASGFYWLFSTPVGRHGYTATAPRYQAGTGIAFTAPDTVTRRDLALPAGRLAVPTDRIGAVARPGQVVTRRLPLTNTGRAPLHVDLAGQGSISVADAGDAVSWLSLDRTSVDLAPGRSTTLTVRFDAAVVPGPGSYNAVLTANTDSPYDGRRITVSFQVGR